MNEDKIKDGREWQITEMWGEGMEKERVRDKYGGGNSEEKGNDKS